MLFRSRSTGTNITGGSIWMPSVTGNNSALLYIQTQSASAQAGADGVLTDNNGVRLKLASQPGGVAADTAFSVEVGSSERLRIDSSGNVGINSTAPTAKLDVNGTVNVSGMATFNTAVIFKGQTDNADGRGDRSGYWDYDDKVAMVLEPAADNGAVEIGRAHV